MSIFLINNNQENPFLLGLSCLCFVGGKLLAFHINYGERFIKFPLFGVGVNLRTVLMVRTSLPWFCFSVIAVTLGGIINVRNNYFRTIIFIIFFAHSFHLPMIPLMNWSLLKWRDIFLPSSMATRNIIRLVKIFKILFIEAFGSLALTGVIEMAMSVL